MKTSPPKEPSHRKRKDGEKTGKGGQKAVKLKVSPPIVPLPKKRRGELKRKLGRIKKPPP